MNAMQGFFKGNHEEHICVFDERKKIINVWFFIHGTLLRVCMRYLLYLWLVYKNFF